MPLVTEIDTTDRMYNEPQKTEVHYVCALCGKRLEGHVEPSDPWYNKPIKIVLKPCSCVYKKLPPIEFCIVCGSVCDKHGKCLNCLEQN